MFRTSRQATAKWARTLGALAVLLLIGGGGSIPAMAAHDREHREQITESIERAFGEMGRASSPQQAAQAGAVQRGRLGVRVQNLEAERARAIGLDVPRGALVIEVVADSPAEQARLQPGDVILEFNGKPIADGYELQRVVAATPVDLPVEIIVWRNGERRSLGTRTARPKDPDVPFDYAEAAERLEAKHSDAIPLIRPAAERGEPGALFLMGLAHWQGIGVPRDAALAERYLQEASDRGFAKATAVLAIGLMSGEQGFRKDPQAGLELAQAAARSGEPRGLVALAVAYAAGLVPGKGEAEAMALVRKAAEADDRMAQALLNADKLKGVWRAADDTVMEFGDGYVTIWPAGSSDYVEGDYALAGSRLRIEMPERSVVADVAIEADIAAFRFPQGGEQRFLRVGPAGYGWGKRIAEKADKGPHPLQGAWRADNGDVVKIGQGTFDHRRGRERVRWGQYRYDGSAVILFQAAGEPAWQERWQVTFVDANRMVWRNGDHTLSLHYLHGYSPTIMLYDMDTYRVSPDYFAGQAPGGGASWCMSNCEGLRSEFGTPAESPWN